MNVEKKKPAVDHESMYISETGVLPAHRIRVQLTASHPKGDLQGTIFFDQNICTLNEWGDPAGCTKMAIHPRDASAVRIHVEDPHDHRRRLWELHVDGVTDLKLHLVEYDRADLWYLVVHTADGRSATAPLFPVGLFGPQA
ncbi:MAG: hypothetical protein KC486_19040 [Myxococcales bacterium]|nr:hypothetical protein [Myxococcales bacterium]